MGGVCVYIKATGSLAPPHKHTIKASSITILATVYHNTLGWTSCTQVRLEFSNEIIYCTLYYLMGWVGEREGEREIYMYMYVPLPTPFTETLSSLH